MSTALILAGLVLSAASGVPGMVMARTSHAAHVLSASMGMAGSALGLVGLIVFGCMTDAGVRLTWSPLPDSTLTAGVDAISAVFLAPLFLLSLLAHLYGLGYWPADRHPDHARKLRVFLGFLTAGMGLLLLARDAVLFLFGWELMALSAFFLVTTESNKSEVRAAGWVYFVATHTSTLVLFAFFALMRAASGTYAFTALPAHVLGPGVAAALAGLALVGFGIKAGLMPLHVWLPGAHAVAPSHVSALMSGVLIKMGIYGLVRVTSLLPPLPLAWGIGVLALGTLSAVLGVAYAIGQHDLKRLLAYHSVENIGIIVMGLGLALIGRALGRVDLVVLGLAGCLLHVWNHALFKGLLFLSAGSVLHATGTREMDQLGGLGRFMPRTALAFFVGAVAICGLPPLNGFISEFFVYLAMLRTLLGDHRALFLAAAAGIPGLAIVGALATACFVKAGGAVFLGQPRSPLATSARESPVTMTVPMAVLAAACVCIGLAPMLVAPVLVRAAVAWAPDLFAGQVPRLTDWAPLHTLSLLNAILLAGLAATWLLLARPLRRAARAPVWGCAYATPSARMQYTSSSFAQMIVRVFAWALRPRRNIQLSPGLFPAAGRLHTEIPEVVLESAILPALRLSARACETLRVLQRGHVHVYLLYILLALLVLMMLR